MNPSRILACLSAVAFVLATYAACKFWDAPTFEWAILWTFGMIVFAQCLIAREQAKEKESP